MMATSPAKKAKPRQSTLSDADRHVARRVAALRREVGLTLKELGERAGLSDTYLSRVENEQTAVTVASLARLAEVFAVPVASFFDDEDTPRPMVITKAGQGTKMRFRGRSGSIVYLLADEKHGKLMEPLIVDVSASGPEVPLQAHAGEEFNLVLDGSCVFYFGDGEYPLEAGDSVYFDATVPHALRAANGGETRVLAVVSSRDFQFHRNISKILESRIQA